MPNSRESRTPLTAMAAIVQASTNLVPDRLGALNESNDGALHRDRVLHMLTPAFPG